MHTEESTSHIPHSGEEQVWARWRPPQHRTPIPAVGDRVLYRPRAWATPMQATVLRVEELEPPEHVPRSWPDPGAPPFDVHCWRVRTNGGAQPVLTALGGLQLDRHPDWWPTLLLKVDGLAPHVQTREARLRGSAGWLPLDWTARTRPVPGQSLPEYDSAERGRR